MTIDFQQKLNNTSPTSQYRLNVFNANNDPLLVNQIQTSLNNGIRSPQGINWRDPILINQIQTSVNNGIRCPQGVRCPPVLNTSNNNSLMMPR